MATITEERAWLREHRPDLDIPHRGGLRAELRQAYADANPPGDYDEGVTAEDFPPDDGLEPAEREPETPMAPERAPETARTRRRRQKPAERVRSLFGPVQGEAKPKAKARGKGKPPPRVSVEHLIGRTWEGLARVAQPLSLPVSRCLQIQSPVAGLILEDVVRDTVVDKALQPIARAEEKAEKILALVAPPVIVATLEQTAALEATGQITAQQAMMRRAIQVPLLKESLRIWLTVAGPKVEEAMAREQEYASTFGYKIDEMISLFFGVPEEPAAPEDASAMEPAAPEDASAMAS